MVEKTIIVSVAYECKRIFFKNRLTLFKLCVSSFLCGFLADLWPFNGSYWNRFALSIDYQGWVLEQSSRSGPLKENSHKFAPKAPVALMSHLYPRG